MCYFSLLQKYVVERNLEKWYLPLGGPPFLGV